MLKSYVVHDFNAIFSVNKLVMCGILQFYCYCVHENHIHIFESSKEHIGGTFKSWYKYVSHNGLYHVHLITNNAHVMSVFEKDFGVFNDFDMPHLVNNKN